MAGVQEWQLHCEGDRSVRAVCAVPCAKCRFDVLFHLVIWHTYIFIRQHYQCLNGGSYRRRSQLDALTKIG